jgi:hypothetical protein
MRSGLERPHAAAAAAAASAVPLLLLPAFRACTRARLPITTTAPVAPQRPDFFPPAPRVLPPRCPAAARLAALALRARFPL